MVRAYIRKSQRGSSYSKEDLQHALEDVRSGTLTIYRACRVYNIPKTTLVDHIKERRGKKSSSYGRPPAIPLEEERKLADGLIYMERHGFGLSRKEILLLVGDYVRSRKLATPFKDGIPSEDWFLAFKARHKLSVKKPQSVEFARKKVNDPFVIKEYFSLLGKTIVELNLSDKPGQIWNLDETSFCTDPSKTKVVGKRGEVSTRTTSSPGRDNITVLLACSAAGEKVPPLIIFKGKHIWDQWTAAENTGYPNTSYAATDNGWMQSDVFLNYFKTSFLKAVGTERPQLLIYDGHSTHLSLNLLETARSEDIHIIKLPPHSSHLLQPLDISVFKSLKTYWDEALVKWQRKNIGKKLPKSVFSKIVGELWLNTSPEIIKNGFSKGGIAPFNDEVIPKEQFHPTLWKKWKEAETLKNNTATDPITERRLPATNLNDNNGSLTSELPSTSSIVTNSPSLTDLPLWENDDHNTDRPSTSENSELNFEQLLLETIKQSQSYPEAARKKRRVAFGAEVVTGDAVLERLREQDKEKIEKDQRMAMKKENKKNKKVDLLKKNKPTEDETSEDSDAYSIHDSDHETLEEIIQREEEDMLDLEKVSKDVTSRQEGDWLLVKLATKKTIKYFVAQVKEISEENEPFVKFAKRSSAKSKGTVFVFPETDDTSFISNEDIECILPQPTVCRRGELQFQVDFSNYNIQ